MPQTYKGAGFEVTIEDDGSFAITGNLNDTIGLSKSQKSELIASAGSGLKLSGEYSDYTVGLNIYRKRR